MTVAVPPVPPPMPDLVVATASVRSCGDALRAASAQVDDLGSHVAGPARIDDWEGLGALAYHAAIVPTGRRADAMSLALRAVAQRVESHADELTILERRHLDLELEHLFLRGQLEALRADVAVATAAEEPEMRARAVPLVARVRAYAAERDDWTARLAAEEQAMVAAFARVLTLEQVERHHAGASDPADGALTSMPPPGSSPDDVHAWWSGLTRREQRALVAASPGSIGDLDGVPARARHDANTVALDRDLAEWRMLDELGVLTDDERVRLGNAEAADDARAQIAARTDPVTGEPMQPQVYLYDPAAFGGDGAIAIATGDLDTAEHVAVLTPGLDTDADDAPFHADRAATLQESTRFLAPGARTSTMFWIGYDTPDNTPWGEGGGDALGGVAQDMAAAGGERLADTIDGLRAGRDGDPAHLTVIGHSYGSTVVGLGAHHQGLEADDLVLVGSPGAGRDVDHAADLGVDPDHVWAGANSRDPVTYLANRGWLHLESAAGAGLGDDPAEDDFGGRRFQAESTSRGLLPSDGQHSLYFDHDTESLHNISLVVAGAHGDVRLAEPHHDPLLAGVHDPEHDRLPTSQETR